MVSCSARARHSCRCYERRGPGISANSESIRRTLRRYNEFVMTPELRRFPFVQFDVFSSRPFEGNPLAVFPDGRGLSTS